ncbi:HNH endonuclease signature motif containing protein [Nocardioides perillae]|uniref:DUF222 domain-containing protein n=1 Tax=Nocardioides perillae TaxID=1119534 RepID=A0A7Y9ULR8_9ACTN|nr:HNH endonuclease signature motif containing protein [Nocardioides perillae]NYG56758.1 hypothetical protein [Nocardioides perillae]
MTDHRDHAPQHPLLAALACLDTDLDHAAGTPTWSLTASEAEAALVELAKCRARLSALELTTVAAADRAGVGDATGATSTGAHWAKLTHQTRAKSVTLVRHAAALEARHGTVLAAMAAGVVLPEQAEVICKAVDALPADWVGVEVVDAARAHLLQLAGSFDAVELKRLGDRILDVVAPEIADDVERERLEREEAAAAAAASFTLTRDGHGKAHGRFTIPAAEADMLATALDALTAPRHHHATHGTEPIPTDHHGNRVPRPLRRGQAFCEYIRTRHGGRRAEGHAAPATGVQAGGVDATVTVTLDLAQLTATGPGADAPATLSTGTRITAAKARLWACGAGIVPVVLGGASQPLDVGRTRRYFTKTQRLALARLQGGCTADGCDWPPSMCHAHHRTPWHAGGRTDLAHGYLLCPRHHARAHDPAYETTYHRHRVTFARTRPIRT